MIPADRPSRTGRLLVSDHVGTTKHHDRSELVQLLDPGDLVVANDAATYPASVFGVHGPSGEPIEVRLAGFDGEPDPTRYVAIVFGAGDHRTPTEERRRPPSMSAGDDLLLGSLKATVVDLHGHDRLVTIQFEGSASEVYAGLAATGRPIQYAHVPDQVELWDVWTTLAAVPFAFESPSAGYALDWRTIVGWHERGIEVATITHAAGISSTGDPLLDERLPLDEPYVIPHATAEAIERTRRNGGRVVAIGTTVVRALEDAAQLNGLVTAGRGVARERIGPTTEIRVIDAVLTGMHEPGESHFELLRAFTTDDRLHRLHRIATLAGYRSHEFGDSLLIERSTQSTTQEAA